MEVEGRANNLFKDAQLLIFVPPGPNSRRDTHVASSPAAFYQIKDGKIMDYIEDGKRLKNKAKLKRKSLDSPLKGRYQATPARGRHLY